MFYKSVETRSSYRCHSCKYGETRQQRAIFVTEPRVVFPKENEDEEDGSQAESD